MKITFEHNGLKTSISEIEDLYSEELQLTLERVLAIMGLYANTPKQIPDADPVIAPCIIQDQFLYIELKDGSINADSRLVFEIGNEPKSVYKVFLNTGRNLSVISEARKKTYRISLNDIVEAIYKMEKANVN